MSREKEILIVALICMLGALRIAVFSAAFPFWGNIDEDAHLDVIFKYSTFDPSLRADYHFTDKGSMYRVLFHSREYSMESYSDLTPTWKMPFEKVQEEFDKAAGWNNLNHESYQPPVYYLLGAVWCRIGSLLNIEGIYLLYWLRFLNVLIYPFFILVAYAFCREHFSGDAIMRFGVPLFLAFIPQDVFYFINNDIMTPLFFSIALYGTMKAINPVSSRSAWAVVAGVSAALSFLVKYSNAPVFLVIAFAFGIAAFRDRGNRAAFLDTVRSAAIVALIVAIFVGIWFAFNYATIGDLTGEGYKLMWFNWSIKPLGERINHPIFTIEGLSVFLSDMVKTFWRGEIIWHTKILALKPVDALYVGTTALFLIAAIADLIKLKRGLFSPESISIVSLAGSVCFLAWASISYNFTYAFLPSPDYPYVNVGRLLSGSLIPFAILYLRGMRFMMGRLPDVYKMAALGLIIVIMTSSEIYLTVPVFKSVFNFYYQF